MPRIYLVSCVKKKKSTANRAKTLYESSLFEKSRRVAEHRGDEWFVLSAKHGLLDPEEIIEPYDKTLHDFSKKERETWATEVYQDIDSMVSDDVSIVILAGEVYREHLVPKLKEAGYEVSIPMAGKQLGHQLQWLNKQINSLRRENDLMRFYELLDQLAENSLGRVRLKEAHGGLDWPQKGVYFIFEPEETRDTNPKTDRVIRVGTHGVATGSSATLWDRIRAHRGTENGSGNHRSSIFRLHVGEALINRDDLSVPTWATKPIPNQIPEAERQLEKMVTEVIGEMDILCAEISDRAGPESDRAYIERNAIALLSGYTDPSDSPSNEWLGNFSTREEIRTSGLWNIEHVTEEYDTRFLDIFERYVDSTIGRIETPIERIAPLKPENQTTLTEFGDDNDGTV